MNTKELLLGCGASNIKKVFFDNKTEWTNLVRLDINPDHNPDVLWDLNNTDLPFEDNEFDEIHLYEVLEHLGTQGDYRFFFSQFSDFWRILNPNGLLIGTVPLPNSVWAWADPGHTRVISKDSFVFLQQPNYKQVGKTAMTDYRFCYLADFDIIALDTTTLEGCLAFILRAIKPSRVYEE